MYWKIKPLMLFLFISACNEKHSNGSQNQRIKVKSVESNYIIEVEDLPGIAESLNVKFLDLREKRNYDDEHIPAAINITREDIEDKGLPYSGGMPQKEQLENLFSRLGLETTDLLILYDDKGLCEAARLWWILQNYDFSNVKLLNGGFLSYKEYGGQTTKEIPKAIQSEFKLPSESTLKYFASRADVEQAISNNVLILDARTTDEYLGKMKKKDASRAGKIQGSKNIDWAEAVNFHMDKKFKNLEELESIYSRFASNKNDTIIVYCHSGVRSAHTTFVLTQLLGYKNVKNYDGSWIEWSYFNPTSIQ